MRVTVNDVKNMKSRGEKIVMMTAYDYTSAKILDRAGIPIVLVGDSLGQVVLGYDSTIPVTMEDMVHHIRAVVRGMSRCHVVGDLPFMSYQVDQVDAMRNAGRLIKEGGAQSVKLEGGRRVAEAVRRIVEAGIPVMGHIGLTPQSVHQLGGYKVQGKSAEHAKTLLEDAIALEESGVYAVVLESVPTPLAGLITERLTVPTIGIGAGEHCDGQVQVFHDLLGLYTDFVPKHTHRYANLAETIESAVTSYIADVQARRFPTEKQSYKMDADVLEGLAGMPAGSRQAS